MIALDIGAGPVSPPGFVPIGFGHTVSKVYPLMYADESVDVIRASHILEHFPRDHALPLLLHWVSKLKRGGRLMIAVPNFGYLALLYTKIVADLPAIERMLMGGQDDERDFHRNVFDRDKLRSLMMMAGIVGIEAWKSDIQDCASLPASLNLQGTRRAKFVVPGAQPLNAKVSSGRAIEDFPDSVTRSELPLGNMTVDVFEK